ncbi:Cytochrome c-552 [Aliiroseovarius pelagivivens]|uniref:Cytochrome c-552 n=2 Tax=Aliiroseovarius pelagivivens TaxID=1639690 RepID=A0A2R8AGE4_9RHOB|nr:Cytochrome c-552 [Aliiroseovarius pelagivivens]
MDETERDMFDTMTFTKASGAVIGTLLVFLLGNWAGSALYNTSGGGHGDGHGDEAHAATGYVIATADDGHAEEEAEEAIPFADMVAAADVAKGEKVWGKCKACHKLEDGANGTGPHLYGLIDRPIAGVDGFGYSDVLAGMSADAWTVEALDAWLASPKAFAPGNKMTFSGLKKDGDRANLVAYLATIGG